MPLRILHVDDDPSGRKIVRRSLGGDQKFTVTFCATADDALEATADWIPDLILCGATTTAMDGPAMLARLGENPRTANVPVVVMTARSRTRDIDHFMSLGAAGVIMKPIDPLTFADSVRRYLRIVKLDTMRDDFSQRLRADAVILGRCKKALGCDPLSSITLDDLQSCAHKLAGAAGVFGFPTVSCAASKLEDSVIDQRRCHGAVGEIEANLDTLLVCIERQ